MRAIWLSLLILAFTPAQAGDLCDNANSTAEMNQCAQAEHQQADQQLNVAYQAALKRIASQITDTAQKKDTKKAFVEAQRLWVQFRDKDCNAVYKLWRDGTIRGVMYWGCMSEHTEQRTKQIEAFAEQN